MLGGVFLGLEDAAGIPTLPGEDRGVSISFTMEVHIVGSVFAQ
jgi:hypothetical protein